MYRKDTDNFNKVNITDIAKYIPGNDIFDSTLLYRLDKAEVLTKTVSLNEMRLDLISQELYQTEDYASILLFINRAKVTDFVAGYVYKYIPKNKLETLIRDI